MLVEAEAIPYEPAPLRGERLLVLAPHPDDEVIGCGGVIAQHLRENRSVRVVIATDGTKATGASSDTEAYRRMREEEARRGLSMLGNLEGLYFLGFPDRGLTDAVADRLAEHLREFRPDLVCVPSPVEIHPDHIALSSAFCGLIQRDPTLFADLAITRIAFYEVSQPLRPNALVDITPVAEEKYAAIAAHQSQITLKDYVSYARGLNAYRAMTLPPEAKAAEAYFVTGLPQLRTTPFSELRRMAGHPTSIEVTRSTVPISVVVRTKDRPALLRQALESVRATEYPAEVVVVSDGGARPEVEGAQLIHHEESRGRSEAMNSGVRAAKSAYIAFLDDDDLFYPEHLATLASAASNVAGKVAWYTDAVSASLRIGARGNYETEWRHRIFSQDFDREALLVDNYIPLTTLLVARDLFLETGGFDAKFDLFEDWDFLIRLAQRGDFARVPRITCEVRHFQSGDSITLSAPEGSAPFREAKLAVWRKHASLISNDVFANVHERQKRRIVSLESALVEEKGSISHLRRDLDRLEREKAELIRQTGELHLSMSAKLNEKEVRIAELEWAVRAANDQAAASARQSAELRTALDSTNAALTATQAEADRLQGLLDMIFRSKTWKLHTLVERLRGRP